MKIRKFSFKNVNSTNDIAIRIIKNSMKKDSMRLNKGFTNMLIKLNEAFENK